MFLTQMMGLVNKMRDHLNSHTFKAKYFNQVKGKNKLCSIFVFIMYYDGICDEE